LEDGYTPVFIAIRQTSRLRNKHRPNAVGLSEAACDHTYREAGAVADLESSGVLKGPPDRQSRMPENYKLDDRTSDQITLDEAEEI
jgi:hypothetical protein